MATNSIGNFGGVAPQPAPAQGDMPKAAPVRAAPAVETPLPAGQQQQPTRAEVQKAVDEMRKSLSQTQASNLQFSVDDETGQTIVRVTDVQTGELIRQIPSEEMVALAKALDRMQGMLLQQTA
jgi:flagellar protein FlaG